jgi:DNA repair protein RadC
MTAVTQIAELTVSYQVTPDFEKLPVITTSVQAYEFMYSFFPPGTIALQEHFFVAYLNRANKVIGVYHTSVGGISSTVSDPRLILGTALKLAASNLLLAHNHPSANMRPSVADKELTRRLVEGARLLDLSVLDHLIVGPTRGDYYSFADEGLIQ